MPTVTEYQHGQFSWADHMAKDLAAAQAFYEKLFGWQGEMQDSDGSHPYVIFKLNGQQVCGLGEMTPDMKATGMPAVWNSYINVDDIQAALDKAASLGATVMMPPMKIMEAGHMAVLQDPTGAAVCLWQKINHHGAQVTHEPGATNWRELLTHDLAKAKQFYADWMGWTYERSPSAPAEYWIFNNQGVPTGGMMAISPEMGPIPSNWGVYFAVEDIQKTADQLKDQGGQIHAPPFDIGVGQLSVVADPQGAVFSIIQMNEGEI